MSVGQIIYESGRSFEVRRWGTGHDGLVLRSNPSPPNLTSVEIMFKPAYALCLPSSLDGIRVSLAAGEELLDQVTATLGGPPPEVLETLLFLLTSARGGGWVLASLVAGREDDRGHHAPTMFDGRRPGPNVTNLFEHRWRWTAPE